MNEEETKIVYYLNDDNIPYFLKTKIPVTHMTLRDFKDILNQNGQTYRYYFQAKDEHFGLVKKEIVDDNEQLPYENNRILCWINSKIDTKTLLVIQPPINQIEELVLSQEPSLSLSSMSDELNSLPAVLSVTIDDQLSPSKFENDLNRLKQEFIQKLLKNSTKDTPRTNKIKQELDHLVEEILRLKIMQGQPSSDTNTNTDVPPPFKLNDEIESKIVKMNAPPHHVDSCPKTSKHGKFIDSIFKKEKVHQSREHRTNIPKEVSNVGRFRRHEHFRRSNLKTRISLTLDEIREALLRALSFD